MQQNLIDLDELLLKCRDEQSRNYIKEAIDTYKAGAYRSAIVMTWIGVIFDLFDKFRGLAAQGDSNASALIAELDGAIARNDTNKFLELEGKVLTMTEKDFQMLSHNEYLDLERLQEDRHRCAHPSFNRTEEYYVPTAELTRTHIRNAVEHLISQPTSQGRVALERLQTDIDSDRFPTNNTDEAVAYLKYGPLERPRDNLLRDFVRATVSSFLDPALDNKIRFRRCVALNAARQMHRTKVDSYLKDKLSIAMRATKDEDSNLCILFLKFVPDTWQFLDAGVQLGLRTFVEQARIAVFPRAFNNSFAITELRATAISRVGRLDVDELAKVVEVGPSKILIERAVALYEESRSWEAANVRGHNLIEPLVQYFDKAQAEEMFRGIAGNSQITTSWGLSNIKNKFVEVGILSASEIVKAMVIQPPEVLE